MNVQTDASAGLRWQLPTGTGIEASLSSVKLRTNSGFAFLNPQYTAFGLLSLRQSLLGGLWISGRKNVAKAQNEMEAAKARYEQEQVATGAETEKAYWDLYGVGRNYAVQKLIRDQAREFLRETTVRAKTGLIGPNQVASARTFMAEQELLLIEREEQIDIVSDRLAVLTGVRPSVRFIAVDDPPSQYSVEPVDELLERARAANLPLRAAKADIGAKKSLADAAAWEWLPTVDLVGTIGGSGLSGSGQEVVFGSDTLRTTRGGSYSDALRQAYKREFPNWSVGIEINIPIGFRRGLGEKDRLAAELMSAEQRYLDEDRKLEASVRETRREVDNGRRRLSLAREGVEAAQEQLRIGLIEFKNGRATAFELVRLGADLAAAQNRYSDALVRTAKGAATLRQLTSGVVPAEMSNERNDSDE
jgi:outer membrane protein TolC